MNKSEQGFEIEYKRLNKAQKEAVDAIEGPVMVVAGPGTGKTQVLALRIANILQKTDIKSDGILCLTFTNSGVAAMRERLRKYIGKESHGINIATFHSFGMRLIEEYYDILDLPNTPRLMDDADRIILFDEILENNAWEYLRPRGNTSKYYNDLKSLITLLKRERISSREFEKEIKDEVSFLKSDKTSISTRGESKGELKKEVLKKIEGLERTQEVGRFLDLYEEAKKEKNFFDYDDVLINLVKLVESSEDAASDIRERYLYVLIDEHQDSSGIQNKFLKEVWGEVEKPNIFVVGDDRQLIYGFGGASIEYFEGFKNTFGKAKLITLVENYRSTQTILDAADKILESKLTTEKLKAQSKDKHPIRLVEADYSRDEIIACALDIKEKIKNGIDVNDCAILMPKNKEVRAATIILRDMGLPVSTYGNLRLFDSPETESLLRVLKIINNPYDNVALSESFFDRNSGIPPLEAHKFLKEHNLREFSLSLLHEGRTRSLFNENGAVENWIKKLMEWLSRSGEMGVYSFIQMVGEELLIQNADDENLLSRVEIIRTILHLVLMQVEKNPRLTLKDFLAFLDRIYDYEENIPLASFGKEDGVKVLTLHGSKGLEFDYVWIAHLNEKSLAGGKKPGFSLPEKISSLIEERDEEVIKRELFVAITRAKRFCTLSYAKYTFEGKEQELAGIVALLDQDLLEKQTNIETEKNILKQNPKAFVNKMETPKKNASSKGALKDVVMKEYEKRPISASLLNNFFECTWKWYFRNLLQLPEPQEESLEFGSAVHASIDRIFKLKAVPKAAEIEKIVKEEVFKRGFGTERKKQEMEALVFGVVSKWAKSYLSLVSADRDNEKSISFRDERFPHLNIYGKIDLVEKLNGSNLRVTDFKTGSVKKKSDVEKRDEEGRMSTLLRQLSMYSYLLNKSTKDKINASDVRLLFLEAKEGEEAIHDRVISKEEMELLVKDIEDYDNLIKSGEWMDRPCNYNSYGKDSVCVYCKRAEIYK